MAFVLVGQVLAWLVPAEQPCLAALVLVEPGRARVAGRVGPAFVVVEGFAKGAAAKLGADLAGLGADVDVDPGGSAELEGEGMSPVENYVAGCEREREQSGETD